MDTLGQRWGGGGDYHSPDTLGGEDFMVFVAASWIHVLVDSGQEKELSWILWDIDGAWGAGEIYHSYGYFWGRRPYGLCSHKDFSRLYKEKKYISGPVGWCGCNLYNESNKQTYVYVVMLYHSMEEYTLQSLCGNSCQARLLNMGNENTMP